MLNLSQLYLMLISLFIENLSDIHKKTMLI